jgi:hypothetical protein
MILPTKHISPENSVLGAGAAILYNLDYPKTISGLWEQVRKLPAVNVYWRYVIALDFLFAIAAIDYKDGLIERCGQ